MVAHGRFTYASGSNVNFIEAQYESFKKDPNSVEPSWKQFFEGYEFAMSCGVPESIGGDETHARNNAKVEALINAFRRLGHLYADVNPLHPKVDELAKELAPEAHGLEGVAGGTLFQPSNFVGTEPMSLDTILGKLKRTYCGRIGADFRDLNDIEAVVWLQEKMESIENKPELSKKLQSKILQRLAENDGFEKFLQARYLGQKRFSGEGLDCLVPLLDVLIDECAKEGANEIEIGMAHRGRLSILTTILGKPLENMLLAFEGTEVHAHDIDGDVKYHIGFANEIETISGKTVQIFLSPNPSHLEIVNPVLEGIVRRRQEEQGSDEKVIPILLHGDAAFIGQGLVLETLNLSQLKGYKTGGTIHIISNNQVGFTTNPEDGRSCTYSSDICKVIRAPVFHVNADDPEAVVWTAMLASGFRKRFKRDVVIDLIGFRRHGHNETDEPGFTQPLMYQKIAKHPGVFALYSKKLVADGVITDADVNGEVKRVKDRLEEAHAKVKKDPKSIKSPGYPKSYAKLLNYKKITNEEFLKSAKTGVEVKKLLEVGKPLIAAPNDFHVHPKVKKLLESRAAMLKADGSVDWAFAELLAFGTLGKEGFEVRLSGQDCKRGTFSSRHGVWFDAQTNAAYEPLKALGKIEIINSPLSELGCLGFEFGYSISSPETLVLWEAQFGDFANGAQIVIDQFVVASEAKWNLTSGLVMLLPHGYEGQGPEHSSARLERYLQSAGNLNIQVCNVTTPAQYFHLLRRQMVRDFRKPLIVMSPKSLFRHPKVISPLKDLSNGCFQEIFDDSNLKDSSKVKKAILCTGKIYYELLAKQEEGSGKEVAILRLEQIYPFAREKLAQIWKKYPKLTQVQWVQEEPQNMGAWTFVAPRITETLPKGVSLGYEGRKNSGSTAEGSLKAHQFEQARIVSDALG